MAKEIPKQFMCGVKRKHEVNPTNWQFDELMPSGAVSDLPKKCTIKKKFPKVYNQPCGNCTSNAALACDDYYYHSKKPVSTWIPSTIFTYYNQHEMSGADVNEDSGSYVETALDAVRKFGACSAKVWGNNKPFNKKPNKEAYENGLKGHEVTKYYRVKSLQQIKKAISKGYPVAAALAWVSYDYDANYVMRTPTEDEIQNCDSGHAIVFVGYNDEKGLFEFRNSWGVDWGNKGYAYMTYDMVSRCIWFSDSYAVVK
jgi:hypothetical protein